MNYEFEETRFLKEENKKLEQFLLKISDKNIYVYKRIKQQMLIYTDKDGNFKPDDNFFDFIELLLEENYVSYEKDNMNFIKESIFNTYYFNNYLYNLQEPEELTENEIFKIYNRNETEKTTTNIIKNNKKEITNNLIKTVVSLVVLKKSAEFIDKIIKSKINYNNYIQSRITDTENTRTKTETKEQIAKRLGLNKVWISTVDKRTRHTHKKLDGQITDNIFVLGSIKGPGPGKMNKADENINCRCSFGFFKGNKLEEERKIRLKNGDNIIAPYKNYSDYLKYYKII